MRLNLLPALLPSWRFFDAIGPAPRVDYALLTGSEELADAVWHEFRPRPPRVAPAQMFARLFWNPVGNETLYVLRCAERLLEGERGFVESALRRRLARAARRGELGPAGQAPACRLTFRVRAVVRREEGLVDEIVHVAAPVPLSRDASA